LLAFYKKATAMRGRHRVLQKGGFQRVPVVRSGAASTPLDDDLYALIRWQAGDAGSVAVVVYNTSDEPGKGKVLIIIIIIIIISIVMIIAIIIVIMVMGKFEW
jgi:hypothetical protein